MRLSNPDRKLVLADGTEYFGHSFGDESEGLFEIVFNTSMVGYQEIFSDPSYTDQGVVMTYPLIGNYGMAADDYETATPSIGALIVGENNNYPSNFRCEQTLEETMKRYGVVGIEGVDTRQITRRIRNYGSCMGLITSTSTSTEDALAMIEAYEPPCDSVMRASRKNAQRYEAESARFEVVAIDCGMKENIVRSLVARGCNLTVVPWNTPAQEILSMDPDGIFISNGPGDPTDVKETIATIRSLIGKKPIFGICLGLQIISLAYGAKTYKLKFGHRGGNHPVKNLTTGKIEITSQNHSYAVEPSSLESTNLSITHVNLIDDTVEGVCCESDKVFAVQYHPESAPGPQDSAYLFDRFIALMEEK